MRYGSRWVQLQVEIAQEGDLPNNVIIVLTHRVVLADTDKTQRMNAYKFYIVIYCIIISLDIKNKQINVII